MQEAPDEIKELIEKFERNLDAYKNPSYKEEQLKQEFINPFFKALGWDVDNVSGAAPQYRDVIFRILLRLVVVLKYLITVSPRQVEKCSLWRQRNHL